MTVNSSLEESVVQSVALTDLRDAVADIAEVGLDQLLVEGPARDVPVLGTLLRLGSTFGAVRDHLFARKVAKFLLRVSEVRERERVAFVQALADTRQRRRVGEVLVLLLDRLDDMEKPDLLGLLFQAYLRGDVDLACFQRLSSALDKLSLGALPILREFYRTEPPRPEEDVDHFEVLQDLASTGLVRLEFGGGFGAGGGRFIHSDLGRLFVDITARAA
jgi:hypothetical protein